MIKTKSVISPTLDTPGEFSVAMNEFATISRDVVSHPITLGTGGGNVVTMANTDGLVVGQSVVIQDSLNSETRIIATVTPATQITTTANLTNTYTAARGGKVTVLDVTLPITGTAAIGTIPMTNTTGLVAGQVIVIEDSAGAEVRIINVVTPGVQITTTVNLTNTYTVARGGRVTVANGNPAKVAVSATFPNPGTTNKVYCVTSWAVGVQAVVIRVQTGTTADAAPGTLTWAASTTAEVLGQTFTVLADGE